MMQRAIRWVSILCPLGLACALAGSAPLKMELSTLSTVPKPDGGDWLVLQSQRKAGVYRGENDLDLVLDNGLVRRVFRIAPNLATIALDQLSSGESYVRSVRPECEVVFDGKPYPVGGLIGQPIHNFLRPEWLDSMKSDPNAFQFAGFETGPTTPRFGWKKRLAWMPQDLPWPPPGVSLTLHFRPPPSVPALQAVSVAVHYELYEGIPLMSKWFTVRNGTDRELRLGPYKSEILATVENRSEVEKLVRPWLPNLHVETDFTTAAMSGEGAQRQTVYWLEDATYGTQVNYRLESLCLLECRPPLGPDRRMGSGDTFRSFRTWLLAFDSTDRHRQTLSLGRMYRTIAPWVTENPILMHVRQADPDSVRLAVDQCAEVGFEMVIMTFGSGFNMENESADYLKQIGELASYAHSRGIALGGYSLLASRSIGPDHDVVNPETGKPGGFATFGNSPCLASVWGEEYFRKLYQFFEATGCDILEHDGSYPGDACASTQHPGHRGYEDSRYVQWEIITRFYQWCRSRGIYLNVPDWYHLNGSNKTGMGYRETNWSLPRAHQEIIERQNIHDGTRYKTPSMGWMFVPLTQYHGGGAAATIEPLSEHLDHYEQRLANLFGAGVQACYRGPRLYDTDTTKAVVKQWVDFYKRHRLILDSDLIPLRRADGRDWDGWLHVNPQAVERGLAMLYNPLTEPIDRTIRLPLYYTGLRDRVSLAVREGTAREMKLDRDYMLDLTVTIPARGNTWITIQAPR